MQTSMYNRQQQSDSLIVICIFLCSLGLAPHESLQAESKPINFNRDIRPILSNKCFQCHGPDVNERQAGLRLDQQETVIAPTASGKIPVVPGKLSESELIQRVISTDADLRMPPAETGKPLTGEEITLLQQWVVEGGNYAQHWSYQRPTRFDTPDLEPFLTGHSDAAMLRSWPKNEIDRFLLRPMLSQKLIPSPLADRYALIRRLSLDLTGLPPTLADVEAFVADSEPGAYERLVDRLLNTRMYGEHWARHWLDLARYADSAGYADDPPRTIWGYRDWVIQAINSNMPFDQFTIEQIAGDLLPDPTNEQLIATAFNRNTLTNNEGGTNDEEYRNVAIVDRVNTTMAVWMGTTIACAQCHNHKFDPISQEDYFRMFAIFNNTEDADRRDESPLVSVWSAEQLSLKAAKQQEASQLEQQLQTLTPELTTAKQEWEKQFESDLVWEPLEPQTVSTTSGVQTTIVGDTISIERGEKTETFTLDISISETSTLAALQLEALPDDSLPNQGPGHGQGNFVISAVHASVTASPKSRPSGQFIRIEIPGQKKILSLAEVQAFQGDKNIALTGMATQSTTDFNGPAQLAIDGNSDGHYFNAKSTTHTAIADNPWWELDLKSTQAIDKIILWNRTDNKLQPRLNNFVVSVLDAERNPVWTQQVDKYPDPTSEFTLDNQQAVKFASALADYSQKGFEASGILDNQDVANTGWAIGGQHGQAHQLTLIPATPVELPSGAVLRIRIEQLSQHEFHTLGRFRLLTTSDSRASQYAPVPPALLAILKVSPTARTAAQNQEVQKHFLATTPHLKAQRERLAAVTKELTEMKPYKTVPIMRELANEKQRKTFIQHRGNFLDTGAEVTVGLPGSFHLPPAGETINRLTLARWLVSKENPLTARVIANRYWEALFGIGLVETSEEFGNQGALPTHPELLDWLATELVRLNWDIKAFLKILVTSSAYRQSSRVTPELLELDPDNRLLARGPRFRLSAEMIRDQALAVSGLLSQKLYGPPVRPPQPALGVSAAFGSGIDWTTSEGEDRYRRGLYTTWRRSNPYPSMVAFDAPSREVCTVRRDRTNTPLQALVTLNDPVYIETAQALARRMNEGSSPIAEKARLGFRYCLARPPSESELTQLTTLFQTAHQRFAADEALAMNMATKPIGPAPAGTNIIDLAAWTLVANVLLNLDEMFMKR